MKFFERFNKKSKVIELVRLGLANTDTVSVKQISDCIFLLRSALGETWKLASKEVAAGMALVALGRNAHLQQYLNRDGWKLVLSFVKTNPEMASNLSPRTIKDIFAYQQHSALPA